MTSLRITVCLIICFPFISGSNGKRGFVLTSPKVIDPGSTEYFTLTLFDAPGEGNIRLSLLNSRTNDVIAQSVAQVFNDSNTLIGLTIPPIPDPEANLEIKGEFPGSEYLIQQRKPVKIRQNPIITFVQTDKPIYKPGQIVRFRVLPVDIQLRPVTENTKAEIWIEDPGEIRIAQWRNVSFSHGIVQLELPLSEEPVLGEWSIKTSISGVSHTQKFKVEEYVLPKFEVTITTPSYVTIDTEVFDVEICAQYSYGKKVDGLLNITAKYKLHLTEYRTSFSFAGKISGCHSLPVKAMDISPGWLQYFERSVVIYAEVTENGTEVTRNTSVEVKVERTLLKIKFLGAEKGNRYFKPGLPFYEKLRVTKPDRKPAVSEEINICAKAKTGSTIKDEFCKDFITDASGEIDFYITVQDTEYHRIELEASCKRCRSRYHGSRDFGEVKAKVTLNAWFSPTGSHLQIQPATKKIKCEGRGQIKILYKINNGSATVFHWQVISRGRIRAHGAYSTPPVSSYVDSTRDTSRALLLAQGTYEDSSYPQVGEFTLNFDSSALMSPVARLLVFSVRPDGEVVSDSREFEVTPCFQNQPHLRFENEQMYPSSEADIYLSAPSSSFCGVGFVDKSVHFMQPGKQLNKQKVFEIMRGYDVDAKAEPLQTSRKEDYCTSRDDVTVWHDINDYKDDFGRADDFPSFRPRSYRRYNSYNILHVDSIAAFEEAGMVVMSDLKLETRPCYRKTIRPFYYTPHGPRTDDRPVPLRRVLYGERSSSTRAHGPAANDVISFQKPTKKKAEESIAEIRSYFPETWLWELHTIGASGAIALKRNLPDTVTEWIGSAVCIHPEEGFGISDPASIRAFQPFFVSFNLPYSVIRNEIIPIVTTVFNYLTECLPIKLTLEPSEAFEIVRVPRTHKLCVCGGKSVTHRFYVRPIALGNVNITVYGFSLEEPDICGDGSTATLTARDAVTRPLLIEAEGIPKEEVHNSFFCLNGSSGPFSTEVDLMLPENVVEGSARAYLSLTGDLMAPALNKLDGLVQLPTGCGEQNMVRFVPNILVLDYLTVTGRVSEDIKSKAISNMKTGYQRQLRYRHSDGSYSAFGERDKEGSMFLTAFVLRSFAQARRFITIDDNDLTRSASWITENQLSTGCFRSVGRVYSSALKGGLSKSDGSLAPLTAYVLIALHEVSNFISKDVITNALRCLEESTDPSTYSLSLYAYAAALAKHSMAEVYLQMLENRAIREGNVMYWKSEKTPSKSINIEISAYAVLAMLETGGSSNVFKVLPTVRWIAEQRNPSGGFASTQDTVVALQALTAYATYTKATDINIEINVQSDELTRSFRIDESNKLTMQSLKLPVVPTVADLQAFGKGCALTQITLRYNVKTVPRSQAFNLVATSSFNGTDDDCKEATIGVCMRCNDLQQKSNMAVATVKMVSGYVPKKESLRELLQDENLGLKRHDVSANEVHFYFDELTNEQKCFQFLVLNELEVERPKPGTVKLYDYYQTELEVTEYYEIPSCPLSMKLLDDPQTPANATSDTAIDVNVG